MRAHSIIRPMSFVVRTACGGFPSRAAGDECVVPEQGAGCTSALTVDSTVDGLHPHRSDSAGSEEKPLRATLQAEPCPGTVAQGCVSEACSLSGLCMAVAGCAPMTARRRSCWLRSLWLLRQFLTHHPNRTRRMDADPCLSADVLGEPDCDHAT